MSLPIALQLYTVRDTLTADLEGTLKKVAQIGYKNVEIAGTYGKTAAEFRTLLNSFGLTPIGMHAGLPVLTGEALDKTLSDAKALGVHYIACSFSSKYTHDDYVKGAAELAEAADKAAPQGINICYHNHSFEFIADAQGKRGMDTIYDSTKGSKLQAELDIYWAQLGGDKPLDWMKKLAGRLPLLHVKDMEKSEERSFAEVGTGTVDIKAAVEYAAQIGVKHLIIEQDRNWKGSPLESAKLSFDNLTKILAGK